MGFQLSKMHRFIALVCLDFEFCLFVFEDVTQAIETFYDNFSQFYYLFQTKKTPRNINNSSILQNNSYWNIIVHLWILLKWIENQFAACLTVI